MNVADQFQQIRILLTDDGFVAILEQVTTAFVALVEVDSVPGHEAAHHLAERSRAGTQQDMKVIRDQCPRIALGLCFF